MLAGRVKSLAAARRFASSSCQPRTASSYSSWIFLLSRSARRRKVHTVTVAFAFLVSFHSRRARYRTCYGERDSAAVCSIAFWLRAGKGVGSLLLASIKRIAKKEAQAFGAERALLLTQADNACLTFWERKYCCFLLPAS